MYSRFALFASLVLGLCSAVLAQPNIGEQRRIVFAAEDGSGIAAEQKPISLQSKQAGKADFSSRLAHADLSEVPMKDGKTYTRIAIPGLGTAGEPGMPAVPTREELIRIPAGAKISLVVDAVTWQEIDGEIALPPVQPPHPDVRALGGSKVDPPIPFTKNAAAYGVDAYISDAPVVLGEKVRIRGREYVKVLYQPLSYNPVQKKARVAHDVQWHLEVTVPKTQQRRRPDRFWRSAADSIDIRTEDQIEAETPSEDPVEEPAPEASGTSTEPQPDLVASQNDADYLIITPDSFADAVAPLAAWKHKKGYRTYVATLTEVGGADQTAIQTYIQNAYNNGTPTTYVLLIGDHEDLPAFEIVGHPYHDGTNGVTHYWHVDHPYSLVDGSDVYPDLYIARLPGDTEAQISSMVNAAIAYDRTPDAGTWYDDVLLAGQFQDTDNNNLQSDRMFMEDLHRIADFLGPDYDYFGSWNGSSEVNKGYTIHTALQWDSATSSALEYVGEEVTPYDARLAPPSMVPDVWKAMGSGTATQISSAINNGVAMVFHRDHGYSGVTSGGEGWADPAYVASNVNGLSNGAKRPFVFSLNCATGWFDGADKFAESWMRNANGGAIGFTGAARVSYSGYNDCFHVGIMDTFFDDYSDYDDGVYIPYPNSWRPAEAIVRAKAFIFADYGTGSYSILTVRFFNWFGDPELQLRTETPVALAATHTAGLIAGGSTNVTVSVTRGGGACEGVLVALVMDNGSVFVTGTTDASGEATLSVTPLSLGTMTVTASEQNSTPYEGSIEVVSGSDPVIGVTPALLTPTVGMGSNAVQQTFTVANIGVGTVNYTVSDDASWLSCNPSSGASSGEEDTITVTYNNASLPGGVYTATIMISDPGAINSNVAVSVELTVNWPAPVAIYEANMDADPGWTLEGDWAYGIPTGGGGQYGNADPASGHTGGNVVGYNLSGDYANNLSETFATTPAVDCSAYTNVNLSFYRWLNVEDASFDHAYVRVSNDGADWTEVYANTSAGEADSAWSEVSYDISAVADGESTVYIRWVMGTTDDSWQYSGWNVDDVQVTGNELLAPAAIEAPTDLTATGVATNQIDLSWTDNSDNEDGFVIERSESSGGGFTTLTTTSAAATSYSDAGLPMGATYYYQVYATNSTDSSSMSAEASATTLKVAATLTLDNLSQPYNGSARSVGIITDPVGLNVDVTYNGTAWAPTNAGSYTVVATINEPLYEGTTNGTLTVDQATPTVTNWPTATGIVDGNPLSTSTLTGGSASLPGIFSFDSPSTTPPAGVYGADVTFAPTDSVNYQSVGGTVNVNVGPAAPTGLSAIPLVGQVDLRWNASAGASSYKVKRSATSGSGYSEVGTPAGTNYTDSTVSNGQTYYYVVSAVSAGAEGPNSTEASVTLPNVVPFVEDFESLSPSALAGQRLWQGSNAVVEAGAAVRSGSQGLNLGTGTAQQTFSNGSNTVAVSVWCKPVPGEEPAAVAPDAAAVFWVDTNLNVRAYSNTTAVTLSAQIDTNTWTHFEIGIDYAARTWQISVDGEAAISGLGLYSARTNFTTIRFENTTDKPFYIDDISIASAAAPSPYENWLSSYGFTTEDDSLLSSNGVNTIREAYIAGLDPTNAASVFAVTGIGNESGAVITWGGVSGRLYNVYWSSNLLGGASSFQLLQSNIPWTANSITDTVHSAEDTGFYRIDVQLE